MIDFKTNKKVNDSFNAMMEQGIPMSFSKSFVTESKNPTEEQSVLKEQVVIKKEEEQVVPVSEKTTIVRRSEIKRSRSSVPGIGTFFE